MRSFLTTAAVAAAAFSVQLAAAVNIDVNNTDSIKAAARTIADGLQSWYKNNASGTATTAIGTLPEPLYWWEAGAVWGGMVDYYVYTNDSSYNAVTSQALMAQVGPDNNYMPPAYFSSLGNDDQDFWAFAVLSAQEYGFPVPSGQKSTVWLDLAEAVWNTQVPRWDNSSCGGGVRWQIFQANKGYSYKNSISNGGLFQISARLARYTGNQTYVDWAEKTWNWMSALGLISPSYQVFDGSDSTINCTQLDHTQWTYNPAVLIYGAAMLANYTNSQVWKDRTEGLLTSIENTFFSPYKNVTSVMYEAACEPYNTCNNDQYSFKAYLARWMAKSAVVYPSITDNVRKYLSASAQAAAAACTGGDNKQTCGQKWYVGGYDGVTGVGQELSAMETVQSLLLLNGNAPVPGHAANVTVQSVPVTSEFPLVPTVPTRPNSASPPGSSPGSPSSSPSTGTNSWSRALLPARSPWPLVIGVILGMVFWCRV